MNSKEADSVLKITKAIKNLQIETNMGEKMEVGSQFLSFVRKTSGKEMADIVANLFHTYIKSCS
jgi:hypothetical protein